MTKRGGTDATNEQEIQALHKLFAFATFVVFVTIIFLDGLSWYQMQWELAGLLFMTFMILLGFGNKIANIVSGLNK